jgi:hypothetical protein
LPENALANLWFDTSDDWRAKQRHFGRRLLAVAYVACGCLRWEVKNLGRAEKEKFLVFGLVRIGSDRRGLPRDFFDFGRC